ncbi:MAG: hypothetical protein LE169_04660, partial [Endomicrobium sp.]|nr:hypothetical protein [Endomicrobium sp.]
KKNSIGLTLVAMIAIPVVLWLVFVKYYEPVHKWTNKGNPVPKKKHHRHRRTKTADMPSNSDGGAVADSSSSHANPPPVGDPASK